MSQILQKGQWHYPSHPARRNGRNVDRGYSDPQGNGRHYPYRSGGGHDSPHGIPGGGDGDPQMILPACCKLFANLNEIIPMIV